MPWVSVACLCVCVWQEAELERQLAQLEEVQAATKKEDAAEAEAARREALHVKQEQRRERMRAQREGEM